MGNLDLTRPQIGVEVNLDLLDRFAIRPALQGLIESGATMLVVGDSRPRRQLHADDAGTYSVHVSKLVPTFIFGSPADWRVSLSDNHKGIVAPQWPYTEAEYFLANLNDPTPHVKRAIEEDGNQVRDMKETIPGALIGRFVSSREGFDQLDGLCTDFLILSGGHSQFETAPTSELVDLVTSRAGYPALVAGCDSIRSAASTLEKGAAGIVIPASIVTAEFVAQIANL
jgi:hypothetical protein